MKKIIATLCLLFISCFGINAQIKTNTAAESAIGSENPFLDASNFKDYANNIGKGLVFPRTDLTQWLFKTDSFDGFSVFPTAFDGMIVYNTGTGSTLSGQGTVVSVTPGFYYFYNPTGTDDVTTGVWKPMGGISGVIKVVDGGTGVTTSTGSGSVVLNTSPSLAGVPLAPTAAVGTNTTQVATTQFVAAAINSATFEASATAAQTTFNLANSPKATSVQLFINGIRISNTAVSISGGNIANYNSASNNSYVLVVGDRIQISYMY
jgi:hypothetical protein